MKCHSRRELLQMSGALAGIGALCGASPVDALASPPQVVRLNHNESPFGPSPRAQLALQELGERAWRYAFEEVAMLRAELAAREGVKPENVFIGEGSSEILKLAALVLAEPGREVIATQPTFIMLPQYASRRGARIVWVSVGRQHGHDFTAMRAAVADATSIVYVCNPNNPTGQLAGVDELRDFAMDVSRRTCVLIDEAYIDFVPKQERGDSVALVKRGANVLISRSFSKIYGLAGLRIGYGIGQAALIRRLESLRMSIPNQAGVIAARASLQDEGFCDRVRREVGGSIEFAQDVFRELGRPFAATRANFMMFDTGKESGDFVEFARENNVMVAPVYEPLATWVRVSMGTHRDMQRFAQVLRAFASHG